MRLEPVAVLVLLVGCSSATPRQVTTPHQVTTSRHNVYSDLVWGRYDVSQVILPSLQKAAYLSSGVPFQYSLLPPDIEMVGSAKQTLEKRLRYSGKYTLAALPGAMADEAAVHALHIFKTTPVLSETDLSRYVCQMVGIAVSERPHILLNFLCHAPPGWERRFEYWHDGGSCYVQMLGDTSS